MVKMRAKNGAMPNKNGWQFVCRIYISQSHQLCDWQRLKGIESFLVVRESMV